MKPWCLSKETDQTKTSNLNFSSNSSSTRTLNPKLTKAYSSTKTQTCKIINSLISNSQWDSRTIWTSNRTTWGNNQWVNNRFNSKIWDNNKWMGNKKWYNNLLCNNQWVSNKWANLKCNSKTWVNKCNNQWDRINRIIHSNQMFQVMTIAIKIQVYLTFYQMELKDIYSKLVKRVRMDVSKEELKEENNLFLQITIMVNQEVKLWENKYWNLTNTKRILFTFNSKLKSIMKMTKIHLKSAIHQELNQVLN